MILGKVDYVVALYVNRLYLAHYAHVLKFPFLERKKTTSLLKTPATTWEDGE